MLRPQPSDRVFIVPASITALASTDDQAAASVASVSRARAHVMDELLAGAKSPTRFWTSAPGTASRVVSFATGRTRVIVAISTRARTAVRSAPVGQTSALTVRC